MRIFVDNGAASSQRPQPFDLLEQIEHDQRAAQRRIERALQAEHPAHARHHGAAEALRAGTAHQHAFDHELLDDRPDAGAAGACELASIEHAALVEHRRKNVTGMRAAHVVRSQSRRGSKASSRAIVS